MRIFICWALMCLCVACNQSNSNSDLPKAESTSFTHDHVGNWEGTLQIYKKDSLIRELGMTFSFLPMKDSLQYHKYLWQIQYEGQEIRDYRLLHDTLKNTYSIDEQNGIVLPADLYDQQLSNWFKVMGNTLFINFDFRKKEEIEFTVRMRSKYISRVTGQDNEEIDSVLCYDLVNYQKGLLKRVEE